jgi:hypothetical protein
MRWVPIPDDQGGTHSVQLREGTDADSRRLVATWAPLLERGPRSWLDAEWRWEDLRAEVAFPIAPHWVVLADDAGATPTHDLLGVLVTSGPVPLERAGLQSAGIGTEDVIWVEYIAIAPSLRPDCPPADRRQTALKAVGSKLMQYAIERSLTLGCGGRIALHAEGPGAIAAYEKNWRMLRLDEKPHPAGGSFPVFFGAEVWSRAFLERGR